MSCRTPCCARIARSTSTTARPRAWLFAIGRNCCWSALDAHRGVARFEVAAQQLFPAEADGLAQLADPAPSAEAALIRSQEAQELRRTVMALPEPFREALVLREMNELSYKEIAAVTGVAVGTVMSRLSRARAMLTELMLAADDGRARSSGGAQ